MADMPRHAGIPGFPVMILIVVDLEEQDVIAYHPCYDDENDDDVTSPPATPGYGMTAIDCSIVLQLHAVTEA